MLHRVSLFLLVAVVVVGAGCGDAGPPYSVTTTVVSDSTTQDVWVYAPDADGSWPVVYALPGSGGSATRDLDVLATELARHGVVVFAADFSSLSHAECGYRFVRDVADQYGGDLTQPMTMVGYSLGAVNAVYMGLSEASFGPDSTFDVQCPPGAPRPEVIVAINGCYLSVPTFKFEERVRFWENTDAAVVLVSGDSDEVCGPHQSELAAVTLQNAGYATTLVEIPNANHWEVVFHDLSYGNYTTLDSDHPAGQASVEAILSAVGISTEPSN